MDLDGNRIQNSYTFRQALSASTQYRGMYMYVGTNSSCSLLPGNQILIKTYLARRGVVVSGGWSNGSGWQQTTK